MSAATTSVCVSLDYGKHLHDMRPENLPKMPFIAVFAGFFSVLAAAWSKTSFALTLIRLCQGRWARAVLWFLVVTLNAIMGTAMLFMWIKCRPIPRVWDESIDGSCIDESKIIVLYQCSAGEFHSARGSPDREAWVLDSVSADRRASRLLWLCRRHPGAVPLDVPPKNEKLVKQEGAAGCRRGHEHGSCVWPDRNLSFCR